MSSVERSRPAKLTEFLLVGEAAEFLGVSAATLRNWDREGRLDAIRHPINGYRLYRRHELEKLLERLKPHGRGRA